MNGMTKGNSRNFETAVCVVLWFMFNIALGSLTKWTMLYGKICEHDVCHFYKFPLEITVVHMTFSWFMCYVYIFHIRKTQVVTLSFKQQSQKILPLAAAFACSVAGGNLSLKYIFPSFNQMLGAVSPLITVAMSLVFQGKRYNKWTWISMPIICGGLLLCSTKEVNFHPLGAFFATGATVLRAAKSIIQGRLLSSGERMDSVTLLYYMAPWAAGLLQLAALFVEGLEPFRLLLSGFGSAPGQGPAPATGVGRVWLLLLAGGSIACLLNITNFLVTAYTSAVTLQVLGNVKNCMAIGVSVLIFRNDLHLLQAVGVSICLFGVGIYNKKGGIVKKVEPALDNEDVEAGSKPV